MKLALPSLFTAAICISASLAFADDASLVKGEAIYQSICFSCHGKNLEGATGPKLTDATWLNGSSEDDIFKNISIGFAEKGMPGFKGVYSDEDLRAVAKFVKSRRQGFENLTYKVYQGLNDEDFDFKKIQNIEPTSSGTIKDGILDVSFVEVQDFAIYFEGDLLAPNPETRELSINIGWQNKGDIRIDNQKFGNKGTLEKASQPFKMLWKKGHPHLQPNILLFGANERDGLSVASANFLKNTEFVIKAEKGPYLTRKSIDRIPSRSIAVGFPSSMSYAYHAPTAAVVGLWQGDSINVGPNIIGRGQDGSRPVKRWVFSDATGLALVVDGAPAHFKLEEYTRGETPTFLSRSGDYKLQVIVSPVSSTSLKVNYTLSGKKPESVSINIPEGAKVQSSDGKVEGPTLTIDSSTLASFSLTLSE